MKGVSVVVGYIYMLMGLNMREIGKMMRKMEWEHFNFQVEIFTKVSLLMGKGMDRGFISMLMGIFIMVDYWCYFLFNNFILFRRMERR